MNALSLAPQSESKDIKLSSKKVADSKDEEGKDFFENLISNLISEEGEEGNKNFLLSKLLSLSSEFEKKEEILANFSEGELFTDNQIGQVTIQDLLKIAMSLKEGEDVAEFPTDSKSLKLALLKPDVKEQLKDAKSIKDILDIAKKNNIEVKNFQFFKEEAALTPQDKKMVQKIKSEEIFKLIEKQVDTKAKLTNSVLNSPKELATKPTDTKTNILQSVLASTELNKQKPEKVETKTQKITTATKDVEIKTTTENKEVKVVETKITSNEPKKEQLSVQSKPTETKKELSTVETKTTEPKKEQTSFEQTKVQTLESTKEQNQQLKTTLQQAIKPQQENKEIQTVQKIEPLSEKVEKLETSETKEVTDKTTVAHESKTHQVEKSKESTDVKKTFSTFAQEFKEKVESYKPPLMKIKMELKPAGLGEVDVTLLNRGNNLQVNINSNSSTIAMFMQNQAEFKNSLINMGFSDLQMNFGDNQKKEQDAQNQKNGKNVFDLDDIEEEQDGFEMIIPQYV